VLDEAVFAELPSVELKLCLRKQAKFFTAVRLENQHHSFKDVTDRFRPRC
jgi:hypothetical protein